MHCAALPTARAVGFEGTEALCRPFEFDVLFTVPAGATSPKTWIVLSRSGASRKTASRAASAVTGAAPGAQACPVSTTPAPGRYGAVSHAERRLREGSSSWWRRSRSMGSGARSAASPSAPNANVACTRTVTRSTPPARHSTVPHHTGFRATTSSGQRESIRRSYWRASARGERAGRRRGSGALARRALTCRARARHASPAVPTWPHRPRRGGREGLEAPPDMVYRPESAARPP
ncbi:hypothetical protein WMF24_44970 [Sorangium sp. So ce1335]